MRIKGYELETRKPSVLEAKTHFLFENLSGNF